MRYQDWDVLVFPEHSKIPIQEFKTSCQVIQDPEPQTLQQNPHLLPTVTSFIPGLVAGSGFRISIHNWCSPLSSRYLENLKKPADVIIFEARLFIDGRLAGSKWFDAAGPWPSIIDMSIDLDKTGEFEQLKFPVFHRELLSQSHWNPGDDLGRVKVIIAEGLSRNNIAYAFERIKNIVAFSFQHAPLDVLEQSSIAWPNASMWRQVSIMSPYYTQQVPPQLPQEESLDAHSHSPRHAVPIFKQGLTATFGLSNPNNQSIFPRSAISDPFVDTRGPAFTGWRHSSSDLSMPDYASSSSQNTSVRNVSDPMQISDKGESTFQTLQMAGAYDQLCEALIPSAPTNTPRNNATPIAAPATRISSTRSEPTLSTKPKPDEEGKHVLMKQAIADSIKSKKESSTATKVGTDLIALITEPVLRAVSQPPTTLASASESTLVSVSATMGNAGTVPTKRPRVVTPASIKVIDDDIESRESPTVRKVSRASISTKTDIKQNERRILDGLQNV